MTLTTHICCKCAQTYEDCKYPLSHGLPTIDTIKLQPSALNGLKNIRPPYSSRVRELLNDFQP